MGRHDAMNRKIAAERLRSNLETLASCCQSETANAALWPSGELLESVEESVKVLVAEERKNPLKWKTLQRLDKRMPSLRLVHRVNNAAKRALERLTETGESELEKLDRQDREDARKLLRDIAAIRDVQDAARKINWTQHERALAQFSHTRSVEPAYGRSAPLEIRCYARALELIVDDYRRKPLRNKSRPLLKWLARIEHPQANSLLAFDSAVADAIQREHRASQEATTSRKRQKGRDRVRKHREWYRGKWLYPGDWLWFRDATDFTKFWGRKHFMPTKCGGLEDSEDRDRILKYDPIKTELSCGRRLADGFYYHPTRHVARCRDCQEAEWWAQGFEIFNGYPCGDWQATTAEGLAEKKRRALEQLERDRRWLQTRKGQQWLGEANRRFEELQGQMK